MATVAPVRVTPSKVRERAPNVEAPALVALAPDAAQALDMTAPAELRRVAVALADDGDPSGPLAFARWHLFGVLDADPSDVGALVAVGLLVVAGALGGQ